MAGRLRPLELAMDQTKDALQRTQVRPRGAQGAVQWSAVSAFPGVQSERVVGAGGEARGGIPAAWQGLIDSESAGACGGSAARTTGGL